MDALVTFLLDNVKEYLSSRYNLKPDVENELKHLENELQYMKAALKEASNKRNKNQVFQVWERQIRDVIYEVDDTIDTYFMQSAAEKAKWSWRLGQNSMDDLAERIKSLREDKVKPLFDKAKTELNNLFNEDLSGTSMEGKRDIRKKEPREDNVVGFEDETTTLISYLNEESTNLEVISIVGMPGLGKTTVAWKIHQDPRIKYDFPINIWVYVSQELNLRDIFLTILKKFTQRNMSTKTIEQLSQEVKQYLERGKFLIFMDDVWTPEAWNEIKQVLPMRNKHGKVLLTSRHAGVAWHANPTRTPHTLRFLREDESWELLQLEIYGGRGGSFNGDLEQVGIDIANQCRGLPLAIIVIAGILLDKIPGARGSTSLIRKAWEKVSRCVETHLINDVTDMKNIISLSYDTLPYNLRECFLYLGMFPQNTEIPASKLIQLWVAEGFVEKMPEKSLEETAEEHLKELITRNLMMVHETKADGEVKTCRVHDTIHEFCKNKAAYGGNNLFQEVKVSQQGVFEPPVDRNLEKYRRLCIHSGINDFFSKKPKVLKARSFLCISKEPIVLEDKDILPFTRAFELIRVLDANTIKFQKFPFGITQLLHLRYLTLTGDRLQSLPDAISKLWNLQTLIVTTSERTLEIKANIWKMMNLRHLKMKASIILNKDCSGKGGAYLQTLTRLSPKSCTKDVFNKAKNLHTLGICGDLSILLASKSMKHLYLLIKLKLVHDSGNLLHCLPQVNEFPRNLRTLILSGTQLDWSQLHTVGKLDYLEVLKLKDNAFKGSCWDVDGGGFLRLEFLYIARADLSVWTASVDAFPKLKSLVLKSCEKLQGVPFELKENLEMLHMERVTPFAVSSAKKIESGIKLEQRATTRGFKLVIGPGDQTPES